MSEMLHLKHKITNQGVLNLGIGSNQVVVPGGIGTLAKTDTTATSWDNAV